MRTRHLWASLILATFLITAYLLCEKILLSSFQEKGSNEVLASFRMPRGAPPTSWLLTAICHSSALSTSVLVSLVDRADPPIKAAVLGTYHASFATTVSCITIALLLYGFALRREQRATQRSRLTAGLTVAFCHVGFGAVTSLLVSPFRTEVAATAEVLAPALGFFRNLSSNGLLEKTIDEAGAWLSQSVPPTWISAWLLGFAMLGSLWLLAAIVRANADRVTLPALFKADAPLTAPMLLSLTITALVKSSSITTCLLVPLAAEKLIRPAEPAQQRAALRAILDVVIGANIATTITAALAAISIDEPYWINGAVVALSHMLLKLTGMMLFSIPTARELFLDCVTHMARRASGHPLLVLLAVVGVYYVAPYAFLALFSGR